MSSFATPALAIRPVCRLLTAALLAACFGPVPGHGQTTTASSQPYPGIQAVTVSVTAAQSATGRAYSFHAVRIDLSTRGLSFRVSPPNTTGGKEVRTQRTRDFANQIGSNAVVAINTSFFEYSGFSQFLGQPYASGLTGVSVSAGTPVSPFEVNHPNALNISISNEAVFVTTGLAGGYSNSQGVSLHNAIGFNGPGLLISNGSRNPFIATDGQTPNKYPGVALYRTTAGRAQLLLLASTSITFKEMAAGFEFLASGGTDLHAMFLDGGDSTSLYLRNPTNNSLGALVDSTRLVGSSLAVTYTPPEPERTAPVITRTALEGGGFAIEWTDAWNRPVNVQRTASLTSGSWSNIATGLTGPRWIDPAPPAAGAFYRLVAP